MNTINFEGLGLSFNVKQVAFSINNINIYWYSIIIIISIIIVLLLCKKNDGKFNIKFDTIIELFIYMLPVSLICARLYFILFKLDYYFQNPQNILNIRDGGLAIYGGILGGMLTTYIYCKIKKFCFLDMLDFLAPCLALGQAIGRWGNFFNVEAYGITTNNILRMGIIKNNEYIQVHPTFLYESIFDLFIFILLIIKSRKRQYSGEITYLYFLLYGIIRFIIEGFRADSLYIGNFKISQLVSMALIVFSFIMLLKRRGNRDEI